MPTCYTICTLNIWLRVAHTSHGRAALIGLQSLGGNHRGYHMILGATLHVTKTATTGPCTTTNMTHQF